MVPKERKNMSISRRSDTLTKEYLQELNKIRLEKLAEAKALRKEVWRAPVELLSYEDKEEVKAEVEGVIRDLSMEITEYTMQPSQKMQLEEIAGMWSSGLVFTKSMPGGQQMACVN